MSKDKSIEKIRLKLAEPSNKIKQQIETLGRERDTAADVLDRYKKASQDIIEIENRIKSITVRIDSCSSRATELWSRVELLNNSSIWTKLKFLFWS